MGTGRVNVAPAPASPRRQRTRAARTRRYLDAAMSIVGTDGLDALTMARLADELDVAVGTAYRYFASKDALVAALQKDAIEVLLASYRDSRDRLDAALGERTDPGIRALAAALHLGAFLADAVDELREESRLLLLLVSDPRPIVPRDQVMVAAPAAAELLAVLTRGIADCADAGSIEGSDQHGRALRWLAAMAGVLAASKLSRFDPALGDTAAMVRELTADLLVAWGAERSAVGRAERRVDALAARGALAVRPTLPE